MITLITGAPGAGKTAALVDLLGTFKDRPIYCDGIPELQLTHEVLTDARQWQTLVPDGAAIVIDEVQRVWRPSGAGSKVPGDIEALETHRHRGLDFFIVTQHPNLVHSNVRRLVGRHVHLRDVGMLGRWWYEWPEATNPETFRNAPVKKRYTLPKAAFGKYKSASLHIKPIRSVPRAVLLVGVAVIAFAALAWTAYRSISGKLDKPAATTGAASAASGGTVGAGVRAPGVNPAPGPAFPAYHARPVRAGVDPYAGRAFVLEGAWTVGAKAYALFGLWIDGHRVSTVSLGELVAAGYEWTARGPCAGSLRREAEERIVTCGPGQVVAALKSSPASVVAPALEITPP